MRQFPVLVGFGLDVSDVRLVEAAARHLPLHAASGDDSRALGSGLNFVEHGNDRLLADLAGWALPVIALAGSDAPPDLAATVRTCGLAGLFRMPSKHGAMLFPPLELATVGGSAILLVEERPLRSIYRQILRFAGYDARTDVTAAEDVTAAVRDCGSRNQSCIVVVDVDAQNVNVRLLLRHLRDLFRDAPPLRRTAVLILKDFARPGFDPRLFASDIRPLTRRVFHPDEGLLALIEGLIVPGVDLRWERSKVDLLEVLNREGPVSLASPAGLIKDAALAFSALSPVLPFLWLYETMSHDAYRGVVLADGRD